VIADIATTQRVNHPLLNENPDPKKVLLVVLTSDRGLCGGFNNNINRLALKYYKENNSKYENMDFLFIGRKGAEFFKSRRLVGVDTILNLAREISYSKAYQVADRLMEEYLTGGYGSIFIVYNEFQSAISQKVVCERILPVDVSNAKLAEDTHTAAPDMIFEPAPEEMIDELLKKHFTAQVYRCMCESVAGEHGARMTAMENATKNAGEMIRSYTLTYNKLRQASITTELIEITSGAEALKG
jgi:F-type H+-transporting ATPase subunit gamma